MDSLQLQCNFEVYKNTLRGYVYSIVRNNTEVDDILQDIYLKMIEKQDQYDPAKSFIGWAKGFARIQVLRWRQNCAREHLIFSEDIIEHLADTVVEGYQEDDYAEKVNSLYKALEKMNHFSASILRMKYLQDLSCKEIAEQLNKKVGSIEMALTRARRSIKVLIDKKV